MTSLASLPPLREIVTKYQIWPEKGLGQHFLFDFNILDRIVRVAGDLSTITVMEIGPGPGGLTRALLAGGAKHLIVIEQDHRCIEALQEIKEIVGEPLEIVHGDAMVADEMALTEGKARPFALVANLPYNISTQLIAKWIGIADNISTMVLMVQKEVAQRLIAKPHTKHYGRLSVLAQWRCECYIAFDVNPSNFVPPPKVMSSILVLNPRSSPIAVDQAILEKVVKAAFSQRRKMVKAGLKQISANVDAWLEAAGIDGTLRAENLSVEDYCRLSNTL
ncbi:MAG: 16S rRNA (adenine(1518)-N(6)/adenine(1519)-N(6))-dimethyltransferase RsmA [Alphaproteobacteria bacterium]|nr:16S rRNA (adenine(1518)-N(6)/adenine(1519)-N(6))-dimethyltransferase RsmA [Alphaproteobacteria bacterium]